MQTPNDDNPRRIQTVSVTAPSRLHFGLLRVGRGERRFGGAGVMIAKPSLRLVGQPARAWQFVGPLSDRVQQFVANWQSHQRMQIQPLRIEALVAPPQHSGLGVGTQLGLAVAALLNTFAGLPVGPAEALARTVDRGRRSAVGAYGFHLGGLIIERGKAEHEFLSPLDLQLDLPDAWRFVLVRPQEQLPTVFGEAEQSVFSRLEARPQLEHELESILRERLAPAAAVGDFDMFAAAVEDYGLRSGSYFSEAQGGPYNGERLNQLAARMKSKGAVGVGQSSWGPTLFCCHPSLSAAEETLAWLSEIREFGPLDIEVTACNRGGARIETSQLETPLQTP